MVKERKVDFCTQCRKETAYQLRKKIVQKVIKEKNYDFEIIIAVCDECGEEMDIPGLLDFNIKSIDEQYRKEEGLISVDDIKKIMNIYNIGKAPLSIALGFGEITITRYLLGQMPSKEYSDIIKKALSSPNYMIELLNENAEKMGETAYKKAIKAAEKVAGLFCISNKMLLTISYIFDQMQEITPLALQKILYFIQGIYMVMYGEPLFKEDCMAWVHGPVYEEVYDLFKDFKYNPIEDNRFAIFKERFVELSDQEKKVINLVINTFGKYSGKVLETITHNESPWKEARNNYDPLQLSRVIIDKNEIMKYFNLIANKYGIDTEEKLNRYIRSYL
ncbi:DUF4065 domain-containing protein [Lachnospiraceae bacterium MD1]|uniref:DUF4065 domain-containing protein n=1 Tax=Variimorphobacter saccharofermentans TaxID=2755051 RepID=A0A839K4U9_9FIRM|nr:type II toxin-antitoxin system antitoxin SocA domain-containing protein [Variimorphobacter saccharofermentans]MBB2184646.1 DUF4065 domain-containing protein [Variimorphobacter saccharofermentans]